MVLVCPKCRTPVHGRFCGQCGTRSAGVLDVPLGTPPVRVPTGILEADAMGEPCLCGASSTELDAEGYCRVCGVRRLVHAADHHEIIISPTFASVCARGLRHHENQDAHALEVCEVDGEPVYIAVVCDGVSSSSAGAAASQVAAHAAQQALVQALTQHVPPHEALVLATKEAQRAVLAVPWQPQTTRLEDQPPHTTLVMSVITGAMVYYGWLGDSRIYWCTPQDAGCPVSDHSWINAEVARGVPHPLAVAEARRLRLSRALVRSLGLAEGTPETVLPEAGAFPLVPGSVVLLCSDGLHIYRDTAAEMAQVLRPLAGTDAVTMARQLVAFAYGQGAADNITACIFQASALPTAPLRA